MSDYVKKQLHHIGFNEKTHPDIYHAFRDMEEVDFRGLIFAKIENLIPNQPIAVQVLILKHIDTLRQNATLTQAQASPEAVLPSSGSTSSRRRDEDDHDDSDNAIPVVQIKQENPPDKAINYSSDSDVEILSLSSSSEEESSRKSLVGVEVASDDSVEMEPTAKKKKKLKKRIDLINPDPEEKKTEIPTDEAEESQSAKRKPNSSNQSSKNQIRSVKRNSRTNTNQIARNPDIVPKIAIFKVLSAEVIRNQNLSLCYSDRNLRIDLEKHQFEINFFRKFGRSIEGLELENWAWMAEKGHYSKTYLSLIKVLFNFCPNLKILTLENPIQIESTNADEEDQSASENLPDIPVLRQLTMNFNSVSTSKVQIINPIKTILQNAKNLEVLRFTFRTPSEVSVILTLTHEISTQTQGEGRLQNLTELCINSEVSVLNYKHFEILSTLNLPQLNYLELKCGLADVSGESVQKLLNHFNSTLQVFNCPGMFFGSDSKYFSIQVPRMNCLKYFCLGTETFGMKKSKVEKSNASSETSSHNSPSKSATVAVIDVEEEGACAGAGASASRASDFINFGIQFGFVYPKLEIVRAGAKCLFEDLHFFNFPALKLFKAHGPWDRMLKLPKATSRFLTYPNLQHLQLPDNLTNVLFLQNLFRFLPNVKKVWMWLPSASVLDSLLRIAAAENSKIEGIYLKTNFCFTWTFEEMLIGKERAQERDAGELEKLQMIKKYKYWKEWAHFYNVDVPVEDLLDIDEETECQVMPTPTITTTTQENFANVYEERMKYFNTNLMYFKIEHIGRELPIPRGDIHFKEPGCEFYGPKLMLGCPDGYPYFSENTQKYLPLYQPASFSPEQRNVNLDGNNCPLKLKCKTTDK